MRRLWTDIVQPSLMPLYRMQRFGIRIDEEARKREIEAANKEWEEKSEIIIGIALRHLSMPEAPYIQPCLEHPEFRGETRRAKCDHCAGIYGEQREFRNSKAFKKAKRLAAFNPGSDDHLRWLLFDMFKLDPVERTDTGQSRVNLRTLEELKLKKTTPEEHVETLSHLIDLAHLGTLINVFLSPPIGPDGRAHPPLTPEGTSIGRVRSGMLRFDADKPSDDLAFNIQNIPERARHIYVADPGCVFLEVDASKIEWILMMLDARCVRAEVAYRAGDDVHMLNARAIAEALGKNWSGMNETARKLQRWWAKRCTHGIDYGMMPEKMSKVFRLPIKEAREIHAGYMKAWPEVAKWQLEIEAEALQNLSLRNCFGRQRRFLDVTSRLIKGKRVLKLGEFNEALAFRPASTNADIWKITLRDLYDADFQEVTGTHDSHLLQVDEDRVEEARILALEICQKPIPELAGLVGEGPWSPIWEAKIGRNWGPKTEENEEGLETCH
jgi:DNA polymerase I-like protein with 3'-5' exonuclease and polymerase domains